MNILAIDTSALTASVAIMKDGVSVYEQNVTTKLTHSETLMPMIDAALKGVGLSREEIDIFAVSCGPGSFTGIRIGASVVKGLAYALDKKVFGISTLKSLAYNLCLPNSCIISPIMDARRGQVYNAIYEFVDGKLLEKVAPRALSIEELCEEISSPTYFVGDGVRVHEDTLKNLLGKNALFAPPQLCLQKAASTAYAAALANEDEYLSPEALEVVYLRKSQAERELEEKMNK